MEQFWQCRMMNEKLEDGWELTCVDGWMGGWGMSHSIIEIESGK